MTKTFSILISVFIGIFTTCLSAAPTNDWENPEMFGQNKEPAHCTSIPFATVKKALTGNFQTSPFYQSLNGKWKFHWAPKPADRPVDFFKPNY
ncbi:MAG: beta-galactosidase, partial [Actinobacteria bacterium]|nr:beta-galactosidase [Actinomycetota bacterium]